MKEIRLNSIWILYGMALIIFLVPTETNAKPPYVPFHTSWDETTIHSAFDPSNRRGHNPAYSQLGISRQALEDDGGAGSANFQFDVPIVRLAGRGLDLSLSLHYNSLLWFKVEEDSAISPKPKKMIFDANGEWPAAGWSLGFGKLVNGMLIDADGTNHKFVKTLSNNKRGFHTVDGSFIDYNLTSSDHAVVQYPNGVVTDFGASPYPFDTLYPTKITDANGNYLAITYRNNLGPEIDTITDTIGRVIRFHYNQDQQLIAIEGLGLNGTSRTLIRLHYRNMRLDYNFSPELIDKICNPYGLNCKKPVINVNVIDAIYYPDTRTGYWFGDRDSYSSYGMLSKISERRGMVLNASSLTEQGKFESAGVITRQRVYKYKYLLNPKSPLTDAPAYDTMTETWEGMDTSTEAVTRYVIENESNPRRHEVTFPDGSRSTQLLHNKPGQFDDNLFYDVQTIDGNGNVLSDTFTQWEKGEDDAPRVKRIEESTGTGQPIAVEYSYGASHNGVTEARKYDYDGVTLLRKVTTDYETDPGYAAQHIFNLPKVIQVYEGTSSTPASRTEHYYDTFRLAPTPGIVSHSDDFKAHNETQTNTRCLQWKITYEKGRRPPRKRECVEEKTETTDVYIDKHHYRGNLTSIKRYADAAHLTGAITESRHYDMAGNLIADSAAPGEQTSFGYTTETQYAYPSTITRGSSDPNSIVKLKTSHTYDFNTGLMRTTTDTNGRTTQFNYSPDTLLPSNTIWPTGARTEYEFHFPTFTNTETIYNAAGLLVAKNVNVTNGIGLTRRKESIAEGHQFDIVETKYDVMGRPWQQSQPYRKGQTPQWSETKYDALGRVTQARAANGSISRYYYDEINRPSAASSNPGETIRTEDPWGRQRWLRTNALGQLAEVIEPDPNGNGSVYVPNQVRTTYAYNALDQVTSINRVAQTRSFHYDSLGRLTHQYFPEKSRTLDDDGVYSRTHAKWSDVFAYDDRSNLVTHSDARGVKTTYRYDNDPLNRLHGVTYDMTGVGDTSNPILPAPPVSYEYMQTGDVTRLSQVITNGLGTQRNAYDDTEGRLSSATITFEGRPKYPLTVGYSYDDLGRVSDITYPLPYGIRDPTAKTLHHEFGLASQLKSVTMNGVSYASGFVYNAAGQVTSLAIGTTGTNQVTESRDYDPATGQMNGQRISQSGTSLLDFSYDYVRRDGYGNSIAGGRTGQLTRIVNNLNRSKDQSFSYDAWGRLQSVQSGESGRFNPVHPYDWRQEYQYDKYGNRISVKALGPPRLRPCPLDDPNCIPSQASELPPAMHDGLGTVSYDAETNRITLPGFKYDAAGNQTRGLRVDGAWQKYQYDAAARLVKVLDDNDNAIELYSYAGASNKRLMSQFGESSKARKYYTWEGDRIIAEYDDSMPSETDLKWTRSYAYLRERLLATITPDSNGNESTLFHHPDRLSTRVITDPSTGKVLNQETFPFGTEMPGATNRTNRIFTSYDRSASTKLDYAVNRYYDAYLGRFTQTDPLGMDAMTLDDPQSLNMYPYVRNDPINSIDITGLTDKQGPYWECRWVEDGDGGGSFVCYYFNPKNTTVVKGNRDSFLDIIGRLPGRGGKWKDPNSGDSGGRAQDKNASKVCKSGDPMHEVNVLKAEERELMTFPLTPQAQGPQMYADYRTKSQIQAAIQDFAEISQIMREHPDISIHQARFLREVEPRWKRIQMTTGVAQGIANMSNPSGSSAGRFITAPVGGGPTIGGPNPPPIIPPTNIPCD